MVDRTGKLIQLSALRGVNYDAASRREGELADCSNLIGDGIGLKVWKGRVKWFGSPAGPGPTSHIGYHRWPEWGDSIIVFGDRELYAMKADKWVNIRKPGLVFSEDPRNPMCLASYLRNRYIIGGTYLRDKNFYWNGKTDEKVEELPTSVPHRTFCEWAGMPWGFGNEELPSHAYYGEQLEVPDLTKPGALEFRDGRATELLGGHASTRDTMLVWGDRGLWAVQRLGFPLIGTPTLIHRDCDCVSYNSIVRLPDNSFVWMGQNTVWGLIGGRVVDIGLSPDRRSSQRIRAYLANRHPTQLFMCSGFYHPERAVVVWSWPGKPTFFHNPSSYSVWDEPTSLALDARNAYFWPLKGHGYISVAVVPWAGQELLLSADLDGNLWRVDFNVLFDKGMNIPWLAEFDWVGNSAVPLKWTKAFLTRSISGVDRVMMDVWPDYTSTRQQRYFSVKEALQMDPFNHPTHDPGGPNDTGIAPEAVITCAADLGVTSKRVKIRLHNTDIADPTKIHNGPESPMRSLEVKYR